MAMFSSKVKVEMIDGNVCKGVLMSSDDVESFLDTMFDKETIKVLSKDTIFLSNNDGIECLDFHEIKSMTRIMYM